MSNSQKPWWQLPRGITRGLWDYAHAPHIARDYDRYFANYKLFEFDAQVIARHFVRPGTVVDLGCGTGRALLPLAERGFQAVAFDLSQEMLDVVGEKAAAAGVQIDCLRGNMVELGCLADHSVDYCLCLFSSLGMIQGRDNRQRVIQHVRRILKPGGIFVLHVHNLWHSMLDGLGRAWLLKHIPRVIFKRDLEAGDRFFHYREIPNVFLHRFSQGELTDSLRQAGFRIRELVRLDVNRHRELRQPWFLGRWRANGWIAVVE